MSPSESTSPAEMPFHHPQSSDRPEAFESLSNPDPVLIDFGFATEETRGHPDNKICGSYGFMAPEILRKDTINSKTDLYSVGVMLFYM